jgi:hypothetical protein
MITVHPTKRRINKKIMCNYTALDNSDFHTPISPKVVHITLFFFIGIFPLKRYRVLYGYLQVTNQNAELHSD